MLLSGSCSLRVALFSTCRRLAASSASTSTSGGSGAAAVTAAAASGGWRQQGAAACQQLSVIRSLMSGPSAHIRPGAPGSFGARAGADTPADPAPPGPTHLPGLLPNVWGQKDQVTAYPALTESIEADVVVIGAGIVGLNVAYNLIKHGKSVVVVEARARGAGQTGRTSAHIMQWHDDFYFELEKKYGTDKTRLIAESQLAAIDFIESAVKAEAIDCDYTRLDGYLFPVEEGGSIKTATSKLEKELAACQRIGLTDVHKVDLKGDIRQGSIHEALLFPRSAEFHPLKYINGLAEAITRKGGHIYELSRVLRKDIGADGSVPTTSGGVARAREAIVLATNSPINRNVAVHARQEPWRTYMLGLAVPKGSVARANWWSTEEIYHYIRIQPGREHDVLLIGGEDHLTGQHASKYADCWSRLEAFARLRWPQAGEVVYRWSGQVYEPADQLHLAGLDPLNPHNMSSGGVKRYIATGDSGQGMTGSAICATVITDHLLGRPSPFVDLFSPARLAPLVAPSSLEGLASESIATARGFVEIGVLRSLTDVKGLVLPQSAGQELKAGEGAVIQTGLHKVAFYRDADGSLHRLNAMCTHLGCLIEWNPNDSTWDCCCHGSCFDRYGRVINGPACVDLEDLGTLTTGKVGRRTAAEEAAAAHAAAPAAAVPAAD